MNTKAVTLSILTVLWVLLMSSSLQAQGNLTHIRVGSFNIANFGATSEYERSLIGLVNIMRQTDPDLIVLQEVEPNELGQSGQGRGRLLRGFSGESGGGVYLIGGKHGGFT